MPKTVTPRLAALARQLNEARHGGKYFPSEEIEHLVRELRSIQSDAAALEDAVAGQGRQVRPAPRPPALTMAVTPIGTILFQPAGPQ